jgi:hypothetical protein
MKSLIIFCTFLAFIVADELGDLAKLQRRLNSLKVEDIDKAELKPAESAQKEEFKCFVREFQKEANNERINVIY